MVLDCLPVLLFIYELEQVIQKQNNVKQSQQSQQFQMSTLKLSPKSKSNAVSLFSQFQQNMSMLKEGINAHNAREQKESNSQYQKLGIYNRQYFLKKITQPKYNQILAQTICLQSSKNNNKNWTYESTQQQNKKDQNENIINQVTFTNGLMKENQTTKGKQGCNMKKKLKLKNKLENQWAKMENFRTSHSICECPNIRRTKKEKWITGKVEKKRPNSVCKSQVMSYVYSRSNTHRSVQSYY